MGQRYGRNQKRAHRERIAELERLAASASSRASRAEGALRTAREDALRGLVRSEPLVREAMNRIGVELGRAMGPHFEPHVRKLMDMGRDTRRTPSPINFDAKLDLTTATVSYIEGRIEPITYRIAVMDNLWRAA